MKTKCTNVQEKCDEWLSTRSKKKISKPAPLIKRHSSSKVIVKGKNSKLWKLTQNSPPPPQIFTNTKQSRLMSYFTTKKQSEELNHEDNCEDVPGLDQMNDYDINLDGELTDQFNFLSQNEDQEKYTSKKVSLTHTNQISSDSENFLNDKKSSANIVDSNLILDETSLSKNIHKSRNHSEDDINSDIEFISQNVMCVKNNHAGYKSYIQEEKEVDSDIEFLSQTPKNSNKSHKVTSEDIEFLSQCETSNRNKFCPEMKKTSKLLKIKSFSSDSSDIEFTTQTPAKCKNPDNLNQSLADVDSDIEFYSQHPENYTKHNNSKDNHSVIEAKIFSDDNDIEFVSQSILQSSRMAPKVSDRIKVHKDTTQNNFRNHSLNITLNTEDLNSENFTNTIVDESVTSDSSDILTEVSLDSEGTITNGREFQTDDYQGSYSNSLVFCSEDDSKIVKDDIQKSFSTLKGHNSSVHKSRLQHKFLPETIKFTDTETESYQGKFSETTCRTGYKRIFSSDSDEFSLRDTQPVNVHIKQSKKKILQHR